MSARNDKRMSIGEETIPVALAEKWLKLMREHHMNRPKNQDKVLALWLDIEEGRWNPQLSIIKLAFNPTSGEVYPIDGQHRLEAIVSYGKPVRSLVQRGLDPSSFMLMDQGWNRSPQQQLRLVLGNEVTAAVAKVIVTAGKPMIEAVGLEVKQMNVNAQAQYIVQHFPRLIEQAKLYGTEMTGIHRKTGVQPSTMLTWIYGKQKTSPDAMLTILSRLALKGEIVEWAAPFDFARETLRAEVEKQKASNANNKATRIDPVRRQLAILDFAVRCVIRKNRILTQRGFDQESTVYLKEKKLV